MAASTDSLVEIVLDIDLNKEPACEGKLHPTGRMGHDGGPAKWVMRLACGHSIQVCEGRLRVHLTFDAIRCFCNTATPTAEIFLIEL